MCMHAVIFCIMATTQYYCTWWTMDVLSDPPTHYSSRAVTDSTIVILQCQWCSQDVEIVKAQRVYGMGSLFSFCTKHRSFWAMMHHSGRFFHAIIISWSSDKKWYMNPSQFFGWHISPWKYSDMCHWLLEEELVVELCAQGYYIYNNIWEGTIGKELSCECESSYRNIRTRYAVAMKMAAQQMGIRE